MLLEAINKKKRLIIGLLTLSLFVGLFLGQKTAFGGQAIDSQTNFNTLSEAKSAETWFGYQPLKSGSWSIATTTVEIKIINNRSIPAYPYAKFYLGNNPLVSAVGSVPDQIGANSSSTVIFTFSQSDIADMINNLNWNTSTSTRFLEIILRNGYPQYKGSSNAADCTQGYFGWYNDNYLPLSRILDSEINCIYYKIKQPYFDSIKFVFPVNATSTPDFESWHLNFGVAAEPPVAGTVRVNYGRDPNNYWNEYHDEVNFIAYDNEIAEVAIMKGNLLSAGSWFANGELIIGTSTVKTTVPDIAFSVLGGGGNLENFYYGAPTSTWATSTLPIQITCDPEDNFFQYSLCKLAVWLFVPDSGSLNKFSTLTDGIKNKPPIGYFYAVKSALEGLQSTSTKAFELNATSTGALANPVFNPLKTGIGFTLWLTFGFWLFNRIRHFEL